MMADQAPDPYDPVVARRNRRLAMVVLAVVALVVYLTYLQRGVLFHVLFKVG